jgi:alcohol dehydrogenase class IV
MEYWFNMAAVRSAIPVAGSTFFKGLFSGFSVANVFVGSNIFPEGKQLLPGPVSWIGIRCPKKRALVITDKIAEQYAKKVERAFREEAGFATQTWNEVVPEAPLSNVKKLAEVMKSFEPDLLVPVGGGSAIDTAKAAWIFYERPEMQDLRMVTPFLPLMLRKKAIMAAVPTTAGTASETTNATVVTDEENHQKVPLMNPELTPDFALLNPEFTLSLPPALTMGCGIDVLAHAIDGLCCMGTNDFSDAMPGDGLQMAAARL